MNRDDITYSIPSYENEAERYAADESPLRLGAEPQQRREGTETMAGGVVDAVSDMIDRWKMARAALREIELSEHPDVTDLFGRAWVWVSGDLYRHCGNAAPGDMINSFGLPRQSVLDNPNYGELCSVCLDGRARHVQKCAPEWGCSHLPCNG